MGALVEHDFERGFVLDEERLRKIHDLVETRISKYATPLSVRYKVSRGDSLSYETLSLQDVVNEDNDDWRAITKLELFTTNDETFKFRLTFGSGTVSLSITGDDRDAVFLLFSDLREYIRNEVLAARKVHRATVRLLTLAIFPLVMIGAFFYVVRSTRVDPALASKALASKDVAEKVNFLISDRLAYTHVGYVLPGMMVLLLILMVSPDALIAAWGFIFPSNAFLFGKRKSHFEKRRRLVSNIFWVIIVGMMVSAIAGMLVWRFTK